MRSRLQKARVNSETSVSRLGWRGGKTRLCALRVEPSVPDLGAKVRSSDMAIGKALH